MATNRKWVSVGKRAIDLGNLDKVLYPEDQVIKAEIIHYYLRMAPTILRHIKYRPLSLIRFPDGIHETQFFQKNRPDWAPEWIEYVKIGDDKKHVEYMMATEEASLVWLANLSCLELHQLHATRQHLNETDYIVFDIDPAEGTPFSQVVTQCASLAAHIERYGYHCFYKTTGGKGIHIVVPLESGYTFDEGFDAAKKVAQEYVRVNRDEATLRLNKEARDGRTLIDVFRNRPNQSIISAYSLRARPGVPVSMPLPWEDLEACDDQTAYNIETAPAYVEDYGDPWEAMGAFASPLHTMKRRTQVAILDPNERFKTPDQLKDYQQKRSFERTPEPKPLTALGSGHAFVIHRHHASRLHYDLRLEKDGVLQSWAVPRGMPPRPGVKRLAVQTEPHPLEYLNFDGVIPKGEYGGGQMWIYGRGRYTITKEKKTGFYFRLMGEGFSGEYRIHLMKDKEWLLERVDTPQMNWPVNVIEPMQAESSRQVPTEGDWIYEVKWDGIRALIYVDEGQVRILSRNLNDITAQFPELTPEELPLRCTSAVFDCEIVCLDHEGKPQFKKVITRLMQKGAQSIQRGMLKNPVHAYLFDALYLDGRSITHEPLLQRRIWLEDVIRPGSPWRFSEDIPDGQALFEAAGTLGLEGIMAKKAFSRYTPGKRVSQWQKIKVRDTVEVRIIGYTAGKGDRGQTFGALQIATWENDTLIYRGKVGSGFNEKMLQQLTKQLSAIEPGPRPIPEIPEDDAETTWLATWPWCEIEFASVTANNTYREPVFLRMRPDRDD